MARKRKNKNKNNNSNIKSENKNKSESVKDSIKYNSKLSSNKGEEDDDNQDNKEIEQEEDDEKEYSKMDDKSYKLEMKLEKNKNEEKMNQKDDEFDDNIHEKNSVILLSDSIAMPKIDSNDISDEIHLNIPENKISNEEESSLELSSKETEKIYNDIGINDNDNDDGFVEVSHLDFSPETVRLTVGQLDNDIELYDNSNDQNIKNETIESLAEPKDQLSPQSRPGRLEITDSTPDDLILEGILSGSDELSVTYGLNVDSSLSYTTIFPRAPPSTPSGGSIPNLRTLPSVDSITLDPYIESIPIPSNSINDIDVIVVDNVDNIDNNLSKSKLVNLDADITPTSLSVSSVSSLPLPSQEINELNNEEIKEVEDIIDELVEEIVIVPSESELSSDNTNTEKSDNLTSSQNNIENNDTIPPPLKETLPSISLPTPIQPISTPLSSTPLSSSEIQSDYSNNNNNNNNKDNLNSSNITNDTNNSSDSNPNRRRASFKDTAEYNFIESLPNSQSSSHSEPLSIPSAKISVSSSNDSKNKPQKKVESKNTETKNEQSTFNNNNNNNTSSSSSSFKFSSTQTTPTLPNIERRVVFALTLRVLNELRLREILTRDAIGNVKEYLFDGHLELTEAAIHFIRFKNLDPLLSVIFQLVGMKDIM